MFQKLSDTTCLQKMQQRSSFVCTQVIRKKSINFNQLGYETTWNTYLEMNTDAPKIITTLTSCHCYNMKVLIIEWYHILAKNAAYVISKKLDSFNQLGYATIWNTYLQICTDAPKLITTFTSCHYYKMQQRSSLVCT